MILAHCYYPYKFGDFGGDIVIFKNLLGVSNSDGALVGTHSTGRV